MVPLDFSFGILVAGASDERCDFNDQVAEVAEALLEAREEVFCGPNVRGGIF
jgi:Zn ribbon nucleic-acid-binding protein